MVWHASKVFPSNLLPWSQTLVANGSDCLREVYSALCFWLLVTNPEPSLKTMQKGHCVGSWVSLLNVPEFLKILICHASLHVAIKIWGGLITNPICAGFFLLLLLTPGMKTPIGLFFPIESSSHSGIISFRSFCSLGLGFFLNYVFVVYSCAPLNDGNIFWEMCR